MADLWVKRDENLLRNVMHIPSIRATWQSPAPQVASVKQTHSSVGE